VAGIDGQLAFDISILSFRLASFQKSFVGPTVVLWDQTGTTTGTLDVTASTTGANPDPDGYTVVVDGSVTQAIGVNGTVTFPGLSVGNHTVQLTGLASNCAVNGANPLTVNLSSGSTVQVSFAVDCPVITGSIDVTAMTTGQNLDPNGYTVVVDGSMTKAIGVNSTVTFAGLSVGNHTVQLTGLASNCAVNGTNPQTVGVSSGSTVQVNFAVACPAITGSMDVTATTTGQSLDPDGYTVVVDGSLTQAIGINGTVTFSGLSIGNHAVQLTGLASNCAVNGANPQTVGVSSSSTVQVGFAVGCSATQLLSESFSGNLSQWVPQGLPSSFITSTEGNSPPALSINGDASFDSGLESVATFGPSDITANGGLTVTFEVLRPNIPLGNDFIDGGVWLGKVVIGSPDIRVAGIRYEPNASFGGRFRFWHMTAAGLTGPQSTVAVTSRRWIPLRVVIRPDFIAEFYVDNILEFTTSSPIVFPSGGAVPLAISGRRHFVDNVQVLAGVNRGP